MGRDDENVPDYDEYLDMGSYYLPYLAGLQLRIKANRSTQEILGATISYGASSLEIEAFAAQDHGSVGRRARRFA